MKLLGRLLKESLGMKREREKVAERERREERE